MNNIKVKISGIEPTANGMMVIFEMNKAAREEFARDEEAQKRCLVQELINMANNSVNNHE